MAIRVERFPKIRAILIRFVSPVILPDDVLAALTESGAFKKDVGSPICRIVDLTRISPSYSQIMAGVTIEKGFEGGLYDPEVATVFLGGGEVARLSVKTLRDHPNYAGVNVVGMVTTREDALAMARALAGRS